MATIDLDGLSLKELKGLQKSVEKAISSFEDRKKSEARAKLEEMAKELGYSFSNLAGGIWFSSPDLHIGKGFFGWTLI